MTIFDRIDIWLTENKVSRSGLARKAGLPPTSLQSALTRRKTMSHDMLNALSRAMGVTADNLLRGTSLNISIRCNQCKHYETDTGFCQYHDHGMHWADFCSRGENANPREVTP